MTDTDNSQTIDQADIFEEGMFYQRFFSAVGLFSCVAVASILHYKTLREQNLDIF